MKVIPDREKKQIVISMTEKEWLYFEACMTLPIMKPTDRTEETVAEIATVTPELIVPEDIAPEETTQIAPKEPSKTRKITPRVEHLFPGFKKPEAGRIAAKGMIAVKCGTCGMRAVIYARDPMTEFKCKTCGEETEFLEPLKRVEYACHKCGHEGYVYTNHGESIKLKCKMCGDYIKAQ